MTIADHITAIMAKWPNGATASQVAETVVSDLGITDVAKRSSILRSVSFALGQLRHRTAILAPLYKGGDQTGGGE